jgi:transcriptional regulator with XRE-family HTH domain
VKPTQVRMARAALNWSLKQLAEAAGVHPNTISNYETEKYGGDPEKLAAIRAALEAAGVEFTNGGEPGVKLVWPTPAAILKRAKELCAANGTAWEAQVAPKRRGHSIVPAIDEKGRRDYLTKAKTQLLKERAGHAD